MLRLNRLLLVCHPNDSLKLRNLDDCHCKDNLHTPNDELDSGGPCVCDDCRCKPSKGIDEEAFNGA